jgi:hypothetical protein
MPTASAASYDRRGQREAQPDATLPTGRYVARKAKLTRAATKALQNVAPQLIEEPLDFAQLAPPPCLAPPPQPEHRHRHIGP